ncbi:hypothetical protein AH4AK4_0449 [Aeromonas hydrophila 4AK4]|nr:hypothetical protein AH4AK4_0449 [Aeromonas hydrophila 4AK4]
MKIIPVPLYGNSESCSYGRLNVEWIKETIKDVVMIGFYFYWSGILNIW